MDIERIKYYLDLNIQRKISNSEAAESVGLSLRQFGRIKKRYQNTGEININRGCIIPFNDDQAVILFAALVFKEKSESIKEALKRVCDEVHKNYETVRKQAKIFSYPSLYYKLESHQLVVPFKSNEEYFGGITFSIDQLSDNINVGYESNVNEEKMIDGRYDSNYRELIELIIEVMSQTYFNNVKNRTKEKIEPVEKFERYYSNFYTHINKSVEKKMKVVLHKLLDDNNDKIENLTFPSLDSPFSNSYSPENSVSPLPDDDYYSDNYKWYIGVDNRDDGLLDYTINLTPPPSPTFKSRSHSRSRSRTPLRLSDFNQREEIIPIHQLMGFSPTL